MAGKVGELGRSTCCGESMTTEQAVSVVIINFNGDRWLRATIESCLAQDYPNLEVIVVDDCSADTSLSIAEMFPIKDKRVRVVRAERNMGISGARNLGIQHADGEFLYMLDSDDILLTETISNCVNKFTELRSAYSDLSMLTTDAWLINESGRRFGRYMTRKWWNRLELDRPPLWTIPSAWFFPRCVPVRFCNDYRSADAPIFIHRMRDYGRIAYWGVANLEYRVRMSSVSNAAGNPMVREMNAFRASLEQGRLESPLKPCQVPVPSWSQCAAWTYGRSAKAAAANGQWIRAFRDFAVAAIADPPLTFKKMVMLIERGLPIRK
jgi:glycosyltransferase involved in cell wall biosynthesis